jgi:NTE family protein
MLPELLAHGLAPDLVVGSSAGAINGAYLAGAPGPDAVRRLEAIWRSLRRREVFPITWRSLLRAAAGRGSLAEPGGLRRLLDTHLPYSELERAPVPLHIVATNLLDGSLVRISSGPAADAVLASCAIPGAFPPVQIGERYLVDGAVASNTPIRVAVELGATRLIVLPSGYACALESPPRGPIASALHAITLMIAHQLVADLERCSGQVEIVTVPPLCPLAVSPYDFSRAGELIERAAVQTRRWLQQGGLETQRIPGALRPHED